MCPLIESLNTCSSVTVGVGKVKGEVIVAPIPKQCRLSSINLYQFHLQSILAEVVSATGFFTRWINIDIEVKQIFANLAM